MENIKNIDSFFTELKNHREKQGVKLEEISDFTKINIKYLEAIENGDFNILPVVYMRLFLRSYSNYIGTDSKKALEDFESYSNFSARSDFTIDTSDGSKKTIKPEKSRSFKTDEKYYLSPKNIFSILFSILALIFFFLFAKQVSEKKSTDNSTIIDKQHSDSTTVNPQVNKLQESQ